jgi:hypothetical protein
VVVSGSGEQVNNAASVRRDKKSRRDGAGQGREVRCRYYRSWGAADGPHGDGATEFGPTTTPRIAAGGGRGGGVKYPTRKDDTVV